MKEEKPPYKNPVILLPGERSNAAGAACKPAYYCAHTGTSMNPTLCRQDLLKIEPYDNRPMQVGDVIVFRLPDDELTVVHRIIKLTPSGICTRGDSCASADRYLVQPADITGRVVAAWRGHKRLIIRGGKIGLILANLSRKINKIEQLFCALFFPLYMALAGLDVSKNLLPAPLKPRVIVFRGNGRDQYRLMIGKTMVGHFENNVGRWQLRRPYRLFVDELALSKSWGDTASPPFPSPSIEPLDVSSSDL